MNIHDLVSQLLLDTKGTFNPSIWAIEPDSSLAAFLPELILCATIVLMLLVRVFNWGRRIDAFWLVLIGSGAALFFCAPWRHLVVLEGADAPAAVSRMEIFTGMLVYDTFTVFIRTVLLFFAVLFAVFTKLSGLPNREDGPDIYTLVLGATIGMCLMASANHLLMVFLSVEMASVPSYALAGMLKGRKESSEAALKYSIYGAGAAGVMLYGISLIAGLLNTAHLPTMALALSAKLPEMPYEQMLVLALGGLMIMVGLAFKLSAVPFHFWCPDVFEGAAAEVNAFLSVASKAAALALLVRVAIGFSALPPEGVQPGERSLAQLAVAESPSEAISSAGLFSVADDLSNSSEYVTQAGREGAGGAADATAALKGLAASRDFIAKLVAFFAVITCTFGNLAAYGQTNIKRLMAYSTIAHAGYMMMAVPPMLAMAGYHTAAAQQAVAALCIYIGVYLFMNLAAFAIIAFLRNAMGSEQIADYAGLIRHHPGVTICLALTLFSLIGLPPLAGFIGKFAIFASLVDGYEITNQAGHGAIYLLVLLVVGGINTAISLFYYLRVVKVMTMDPEPADRVPFTFSSVSLQGAYVWLVTAPTVALFFFWDQLNLWAQAAASHLLM